MQLVVSKNKLTASLFSVTVSCQHQTNIITWGSLFNYKQKSYIKYYYYYLELNFIIKKIKSLS